MPGPTSPDPLTGYYAGIAADLASSNPQTALVGAESAANAPQVASTEAQLAQIEQQMGTTGPLLQQQTDYQNTMAGFSLGKLGIEAQQQGLSVQGLEQNYGLTLAGQEQQGQQNALNYQLQMQQTRGGNAASGTLGTAGSRQQIGTVMPQEYAWEQATLGRQEAQSAGDFSRAMANANLMAQANGLSQQEVYARLAYGLDQLGQQADPTSLLAQAGGLVGSAAGTVGQAASAAGLLGEAGMETGMSALSALG
jgi:hypothetical protein